MVFIVWGEPIQFVHTEDEPKSLTKCLSSIAHWIRETLSTPPQSDTQLEPISRSNRSNESLTTTTGRRIQETFSCDTISHRFSGDRRVRDTSYMRSQGAS